MIMDVVLAVLVVVVLTILTAVQASRDSRAIRPLLWLALAEYLGCGAAQYVFGAELDANTYLREGREIARLMDASFGSVILEVVALLLQRPSILDDLVIGAGTNTGSMAAATGLLLFVVRGSPYAAQALVAGLAMQGALGVFSAFRDAHKGSSPQRLFAATVLFPSIAFWTAALHKEAFCLMGMGLFLTAWRAALQLKIRALFFAPLGLLLLVMFRAPTLPPLVLGIVVHFVVDRARRVRGPEATLVAPVYLAVGLAMVALGMVWITRISPNLSLDHLSETVAVQQRAWGGIQGGSSFDVDAPSAETIGSQLAGAPLALVNALLRPQLFDVRNPLLLISALEMTAITWLLLRVFRLHGVRGAFLRIQRSPFLMMCTVVTVVGCTFVGLTTRNFGSMARYRVPFLPFYGTLLAVLTQQCSLVPQTGPRPGNGAPQPKNVRGPIPRLARRESMHASRDRIAEVFGKR
jgi:hypothetical protein